MYVYRNILDRRSFTNQFTDDLQIDLGKFQILNHKQSLMSKVDYKELSQKCLYFELFINILLLIKTTKIREINFLKKKTNQTPP